MKLLRLFSRLIIGAVFCFSGFVKAVDPLGSTYKFQDYFEAFHIGFLSSIALPLAILLSTAELLIGLCLISGFRMKITAWALMVFMSFFTILTFIIAVKNPVTDCGCFGDALILTNWQTFWKNIIFLVPTIIVFVQRNNYHAYYKIKLEWSIIGVYILAVIILSVYCLRHLPVIDFRPYKSGTSIVEGRSQLKGSPQTKFDYELIYEKNGVKKSFGLKDAPTKDSTWKYVEAIRTQIAEGYEPPIHDFSLVDRKGNDVTDSVLHDNEFAFLLISYNLEKANKEGLKKANEIARACGDQFNFYCMTASTGDQINKITKQLHLNFNIYSSDEIMLKTVVRSNPGLVLIKNGMVVRKWHYNDFPGKEKINEYNLVKFREKYRKRFNRSVSLNFSLILLLAISIFYIGMQKFYKK